MRRRCGGLSLRVNWSLVARTWAARGWPRYQQTTVEMCVSARGRVFLDEWLRENIQIEAYPEEGKPDGRVQPLVERCLIDAKGQGISSKDIEEDCGPIREAIAKALMAATDTRVQYLVVKDDD